MKLILVALLLFYMQCVSANGVYKWVDSTGKTHFSDRAPSDAASKAVPLKVNSLGSGPSALDSGAGVVMYSTDWCGYCKKARAYFRANNITFTDHDIEKDSSAKREYDRLGGRGVPLILVGDKQMNGFSIGGFERLRQ